MRMKITDCAQLVHAISSFVINAERDLSTDFRLTNNNNYYHFFFSFF